MDGKPIRNVNSPALRCNERQYPVRVTTNKTAFVQLKCFGSDHLPWLIRPSTGQSVMRWCSSKHPFNPTKQIVWLGMLTWTHFTIKSHPHPKSTLISTIILLRVPCHCRRPFGKTASQKNLKSNPQRWITALVHLHTSVIAPQTVRTQRTFAYNILTGNDNAGTGFKSKL